MPTEVIHRVEPLIEGARPAEPAASSPSRPVRTRGKSPTAIAFARLRTDRVAVICGAIFLFFVLIAIFAPLLAKLEGQSPTAYHQELVDDYGFPTIGPTSEHWFGVEPRLGRDLFARWVYGSRPSLIVATSVTIITSLLGVVVGLVAGFAGGWTDRILSWVIDFVLSLPYLLFAIAVPAVLLSIFVGPADGASVDQVSRVRFISLILVLSLFGWAGLARLIRGEVLSLREREFIAAARVLGVPTSKVLFKELLPNLVAPIVVSTSMALPSYIVVEAGLTYLGVGLTEPTPSWGVTISAAQSFYRADPLYLWLPVLGITVLVVALSLLGDSVRDAFDPRTRR
ncbi:ABC transporter permease [Winogradskya consettensis]|uniref:Peptide ABC transporter permease n=1 Tax=Winogradskya consettensis TaxID=113560 RepID=A0A919VU61_9ACTN|nr:ABC transporter permease [Actinoplanes consettensis]GIM75460.1 peptide ABC transporter permease [Actinoplanes consettensis]